MLDKFSLGNNYIEHNMENMDTDVWVYRVKDLIQKSTKCRKLGDAPDFTFHPDSTQLDIFVQLSI